MNDLATFKDLTTWACWQVITGITKGEPLERIMSHILAVARQWKPTEPAKGD